MPATTLTPLRRNTTMGITCLIAGIAVFSVQDLILKLISGAYPLYEAMILRSLTAFPILLALVHWNGGMRSLITAGWGRMVGRGLIMFSAYASYYLALAALPLANTVALYFGAPLFITLLSVTLLGEHVSARRWIAVVIGLIGVLVVLRPSSELFDWAALLAVWSGLAYGAAMVDARKLGAHHSAAALAFYGNAVFLGCASLMAVLFSSGAFADESHRSLGFLLRGWVAPNGYDLFLMMGCGVIAATGMTLLTQAYRVAESSVVAPFEYTAMVWGVIYGWIFWNDWPDTTGWIGIGIIVASGLYVLYRERIEKRARSNSGFPA